MQIKLIWAQARHRVIGKDGSMPWHLPEDLAHLKAKTMGCPVIMGRKTWESIPPRFRPLPGRRNIVLTRSKTFEHPGLEVAQDIHEALGLCETSPLVWIIGGAQIYAQALPLAHGAEVTEIDVEVGGDAHAPALPAPWTTQAGPWQASPSGLRFRFVSCQAPTPPGKP